jgi:LPXTG-motif cell wall-anchored protein
MPDENLAARSVRWQERWVTPVLLVLGLLAALLSAAVGAVPWYVGGPIAALCGVALFQWRQRMAVIILVAAAAVLSMFAAPVPSEAAGANAVSYQIDLVFDDGGTASGSFVFDPDIPCKILSCWTSGAYSQISITVSPWGTGTCASQFPDPRTYTEANLSNTTKEDWLAFAPSLNFDIVFATPLGAAGPVGVSTLTVEFSGAGCTRYAVSGTAVGSLVNPATTTTEAATTTTEAATTTTEAATTTTDATTTTTDATTTTTDATTTTTDAATSTTSTDATTTIPLVLPATGDPAAITALLGAFAIGLGVAAILATRRRTA